MTKYSKTTFFDVVTIIGILGLVGAIIFGGLSNIYKLCHNDFEAPYKSEIIRGVGIFIAPVGVIAGYMTIGDENDDV